MPQSHLHQPRERPLEADEAAQLAQAMRVFGSASRIKLLWALLDGERTVVDLAAGAELEQSAASHQLRLLRQMHLVAVRRAGRHAHYRLHDHHLPELLAAIRNHRDHVQSSSTRPDAGVELGTLTAETKPGGSG